MSEERILAVAEKLSNTPNLPKLAKNHVAHLVPVCIIIIIIIITELLWRLLQSIVRPTAPYNMRVHKND